LANTVRFCNSVCNSEKIIKIGQYLPKLCSNEKGVQFLLAHSVVARTRRPNVVINFVHHLCCIFDIQSVKPFIVSCFKMTLKVDQGQ